MTRDANDVYSEVLYADSKTELIDLEKKYVDRKDWTSALVVTNALIEYVHTRKEFLECGKKSDKYWENFCRDHENGGNNGNGENNGGNKSKNKGRISDYGS